MIDSLSTTDTPATVEVRPVDVSAAVRALCTLSRVTYSDAFLLEPDPAPDRTAEEWARAILEGAPAATQRSLRRSWFALGLKLGSAPPDRSVLGWEIRHSTRDSLQLAAASRVGMPAELVVMRDQGGLLLATLIHHQNPLMRAIWSLIAAPHREVVPRLLGRAARQA